MVKHRHKGDRARVVFGFILFILVAAGTILWASGARTPNLPTPPLKDLASRHNVMSGNQLTLDQLDNKPDTNILNSQYSLLATQDGAWTSSTAILRPSANSYNFKSLDKVFAYAKTNHLDIQVNDLIWGESNYLPRWLKNGHFSQSQLGDIINQHIQTLVGRYKGSVSTWVVANEPFSRAAHINGLHDWWADNTGSQAYIDQAFIRAHLADPKARLIINDFDNETENKVGNAMYNYVKAAKMRGIPIDGVGMEMHLDGSKPPSKDQVIKNMQRFGKLGVSVYVTAFDVNMGSFKGSAVQRDRAQANIYHDMARACLEVGDCVSFTQSGISGSNQAFDSKYRPKPAFYSFRQAWEQP